MDDLLKNETVSIRRGSAGRYVKGFYVPGKDTTFSIKASVQPLVGDELLQLPESDRRREWLEVFSESEMKPDDIMIRRCVEYEVRSVEPWNDFDGFGDLNHYAAKVARIDNQKEN